MSFKIALDGPSSAGKSTIAKILAKVLGYIYIDTGAMYRAIAYYLIENDIDYNNEDIVNSVLDKIDVTLDYDKDNNLLVYLNNKDISGKIRTQKVGEVASITSQYPKLREKLVSLQRKLAKKKSCIMDGRDIASNVLPDANLKFYIDATVDCRAERRYKEEIEKGINTSIEKVKKELEDRDYRDSHREHNPLIRVPDAIPLDTTGKTGDEMVDYILEKYF